MKILTKKPFNFSVSLQEMIHLVRTQMFRKTKISYLVIHTSSRA